MQKKRIPLLTLIAFISTSLINFVSAFSHYSFSNFSIEDFFNINPSDLLLGGIFLLSFWLLNILLGRAPFLKDKNGDPIKSQIAIGAFLISMFIIYGINRIGFDFEGLFFSFGITTDLMYPIVAIILIVGSIFITMKYNFGILLLILGGFFALSSFFVYEGATMLILGILLLAIGLIWTWRKKKDKPVDWRGGLKKGVGYAGKGVGYDAKGIGYAGKGLSKGALGAGKYAKERYQDVKAAQQRKQEQAFTNTRVKEELKEQKRREKARKEQVEQEAIKAQEQQKQIEYQKRKLLEDKKYRNQK